MPKPVEHYFEWKCPHCGWVQTEGVNKDQGPFLALICENCLGEFDTRHLNPDDAREWQRALDAAETD